MKSNEINNLGSTAKIGYWSSLLMILIYIVHSISYYPVIKSRLVPVENFDIIAYTAILNQSGILTSGFIPQASALIGGMLFLILTACIFIYAPSNKKIFALLSLCFAVMSCTLLSMCEFAQWISLRRSAMACDFSGLAQYTQGNMNSFVFAMLVLSVHVLMSLSCLFLVPIFTSNKIEKTIAGLFAFCGALGVVSMIGMATGKLPLLFFHDGLGTIALLTAAVLLMRFWKGIEKKSVL